MGELIYANDIHAREQAKIEAARLTQKSGNERRGAESELQRFSASLANRRTLDAAGSQINSITENIARNLEAAAAGTFSNRIAASEEMGATVAAAAAAGLGGSSLEMYNATLRLSQSMTEEQQARHVNSDNIGASASRGDTLMDAVGSMDNNVYRADLSFNEYVDHNKMGMFTRLATVGAAAAATYFGGPQAGMAVVGIAEGSQKASNGDYGGASQDIMGGIQNGISAFKATREAGGGTFWQSTKDIKQTKSVRLK